MSENNGHATKHDLLDVEGRLLSALRGDIGSLGIALHGDIERLETHLCADIQGLGTRLSDQFSGWGHSCEQKMRRVEFSDATTVERLSILEERIFTLERRVAVSKG
jgi:hypothetical protein